MNLLTDSIISHYSKDDLDKSIFNQESFEKAVEEAVETIKSWEFNLDSEIGSDRFNFLTRQLPSLGYLVDHQKGDGNIAPYGESDWGFLISQSTWPIKFFPGLNSGVPTKRLLVEMNSVGSVKIPKQPALGVPDDLYFPTWDKFEGPFLKLLEDPF